MDIQLVCSVYGVTMQICKSEPEGLKSAIRKVLEQLSENESMLQVLKCSHIGKYLHKRLHFK